MGLEQPAYYKGFPAPGMAVRIIPKYFISFGANGNVYFLKKISNSTCLLLVYREAMDFYILSLYPATSLYYKYL